MPTPLVPWQATQTSLALGRAVAGTSLTDLVSTLSPAR